MRDRLTELARDASAKWYREAVEGTTEKTSSAYIADHLLTNGVVLPPVSVGQTVWVYNQTANNIYRNTVICIKIAGTSKYANKISVKYINQRGETSIRKFAWSQIGKQVFLSEEEAVQALVERRQNEH